MELPDLAIEGLLNGQIALVTGGGRGIGRATALHLGRAGADVCVADLNEADAALVADELRGLGRRALAVGGDVAADAARRAILRAAEDALAPIDILVNNAGIHQSVDLFELSEADWDRMQNVNAKAVFFLSQLVMRGMVERRRGAIVSLASVAGKVAGGTSAAHYNVSKAAVIAMTKTFAAAGAPHGVRVNCVCPGIVDTEMWRQIDREQGQRTLGLPAGDYFRSRAAMVPMGRAATPADVARVILFLASPLAGFMTGQAINVSGGSVTF